MKSFTGKEMTIKNLQHLIEAKKLHVCEKQLELIFKKLSNDGNKPGNDGNEIIKTPSSTLLSLTIDKVHEEEALSEIKRSFGRPFTTQETESPHEKHKFLTKSKLSFVGAPLAAGQRLGGVELAPKMMREESELFEKAEASGWKVEDDGDIDFDAVWEKVKEKKSDPKDVLMNDCHQTGVCSKKIADVVEEKAREGGFVLAIGGDHAIAFGSLNGVLRARPDTVVVWVDAHADINTPETTPSGNLHGMPLSAHLGISDFSRFPGWDWIKSNRLEVSDIVFIGLRDLDPTEIKILKGIGAHVYDRFAVDRYGIGSVMEQVMRTLNPEGLRPMHLSFDIDAIDPQYAPSTGTSALGGLTYREAMFITEFLAKSKTLCSMDLAEINPSILRGAPAGKSHDVITKENVDEIQISEFERAELEKNPMKTLNLGEDLILAALGATSY